MQNYGGKEKKEKTDEELLNFSKIRYSWEKNITNNMIKNEYLASWLHDIVTMLYSVIFDFFLHEFIGEGEKLCKIN